MSTASRSSLVVKISPCSRLRISLSIYLSIRRTVSALLAETVSSDNYLIMRLVTRRHTGEAAGKAAIAGGRQRRWRHLLRVLTCPHTRLDPVAGGGGACALRLVLVHALCLRWAPFTGGHTHIYEHLTSTVQGGYGLGSADSTPLTNWTLRPCSKVVADSFCRSLRRNPRWTCRWSLR